MNREVYKHLLQTYGRQPGIWAGVFGELVRTLLIRILGLLVIAEISSRLAASDVEGARRFAWYFLLVYVAAPIIGVAGDLIAHRSENKLWVPLVMSYYEKLTGKDMAFYRDHQTGYLASLFRQYLEGSLGLVRLLRVGMVRIAVSMTIPALVLFIADWRVGLAGFGIVVVQIIYVMWSSSMANKYREMSHEIYRKVTGEVSDQITNVIAFKSGGVEKQAHTKVSALADQEAQAFWLRRKTTLILDLPRSLLTAAGVTIALLIVLSNASGDPRSVGLVVLTLTFMLQILRNVAELPELIGQVDDFVTKIHPTLAYLDDNNEKIVDPKRPKRLTIKKGAITIAGVDFSYPSHADGRRISVFRDLNIDIAGGERVGIVGLSGAGKSTLAGLIMRFDDVMAGSIRIDGIDVRDVRQSELRQKIAYVPQEPLLFHRSVRENIAYFNEKATEKDVIRAAKAAHAHEFIVKLPKGYDTIVGERGVKLSGGQKQRVAIARAVLKGAPIMLFDEATSALDSESEQIIQRALPKIIGKHTAIVIAHRLSTIAGLDRIIVMHDGKVVEGGTHDELLAMDGRYASLWRKQTNGHE